MSERPVGVGIIGCGVISGAYLQAAQAFPQIEIQALADLDPAAAEARGREFGVGAMAVDALLASDEVEIVLNLTIPKAHVPVGRAALAAGKHVYLEKPLGVSCAEAGSLLEEAAAQGLRVGCAPDTFLGGGHQTARRLLDEGAIGEAVGGTAFLMLPGHERWHPNPDFYYARSGGGPMLDMGPYYITDLVNLLGPVAEVAAFGRIGRSPRVIQQRAARRRRDPGRVHHAHRGRDGVRERRHRPDRDQLRGLGAQAHADRALRHRRLARGARSQPLRRHGRVVPGRRRLAGDADEPWLCRWQLPQPRARRHGGGVARRSGRTGRAARSPITCSR